MRANILVIGAGFSGCTIARTLSEAGFRVTVVDERRHVAGNCHTERCKESGVLLHTYGPHIFHTDDEEVWKYVNSFGLFSPYVNRVKATFRGQVYSLPINLHTINQFFGVCFSPVEARRYIEKQADSTITSPTNFEEQALCFIGRPLYEAFLAGYTKKQWGRPPSELPASILRRLPVRFNYEDNYYSHRFQGIPVEGYTALVEKILDSPNVELRLGEAVNSSIATQFDHTFYSGPIDAWFDNCFGRLSYRTLRFEKFSYDGDYQGCAVMNYSDEEIPYTRITQHNYFSPWESHEKSVCYKEYSSECQATDIPYYPIRLVNDKITLTRYVELAQAQANMTFVGRLGTYRYIDMDITIREALDVARSYIESCSTGMPSKRFSASPL